MSSNTKEMNLIAFGPVDKKPRYLYSRNNLKIMYETDKPKVILEARAKKLRDLGFNPEKDRFSKEETEIMLFFDYLEAMLTSFRLRAQAFSFRAPYLDLNGRVRPEAPIDKKWDMRPAIRMLSNFSCSIEICGIEIRALREKPMPVCLENWRKKLSGEMSHDYAFYQKWKEHCIEEVVADLLKIV